MATEINIEMNPDPRLGPPSNRLLNDHEYKRRLAALDQNIMDLEKQKADLRENFGEWCRDRFFDLTVEA